MLDGRDFVTPEDVKAVAVPALAHRLTLRPEMWMRRVAPEDVVRSVLGEVPAPPTVPPHRERGPHAGVPPDPPRPGSAPGAQPPSQYAGPPHGLPHGPPPEPPGRWSGPVSP